MENLAMVKTSELTEILDQLSCLRSEIKQLKESAEQTRAYSIQQTAEILNLHYNTVRKLILNGKIFAKYIEGDSGKCIVPYLAIKKYLEINVTTNP